MPIPYVDGVSLVALVLLVVAVTFVIKAVKVVPQQNACILIAAVQGLAFRWILSDNRFELSDQADAVITTLIEGWAPRA